MNLNEKFKLIKHESERSKRTSSNGPNLDESHNNSLELNESYKNNQKRPPLVTSIDNQIKRTGSSKPVRKESN